MRRVDASTRMAPATLYGVWTDRWVDVTLVASAQVYNEWVKSGLQRVT